MNEQTPEKRVVREDGALEVHSIFYTIQGEGPYAGQPAVFIRLTGCNLQCPMCDTDYTSKRQLLGPATIVCKVAGLAPMGTLVVITGGEPLRQNLSKAIEHLLGAAYRVQIETNGTLYQELPWEYVTVVCSPKTGRVHPKLLPHIAAFKYVLDAASASEDGLPRTALAHPNSGQLARPPVGFAGTIYLQPADTKSETRDRINLTLCIVNCMKYGYTLGLQLHKMVGLD